MPGIVSFLVPPIGGGVGGVNTVFTVPRRRVGGTIDERMPGMPVMCILHDFLADATFLVKPANFRALFGVTENQRIERDLFKHATPAVKRLRQQATTEARLKARREWKAANMQNARTTTKR